MVFVPTDNAVTASMRYLWEGQQVENTLSFYRAEGWTEVLMEQLGNLIINWRTNQLRSLQAPTLSMLECYLVDQSAEDAPAVTVTVPTGDQPGTGTTASQPNNVTWAIQFRTAFRGRSGRGRNYALGLMEGQVTGSAVSISVANAYTDAYEVLAGDLDGLDAQHVIISKFQGKVPRPSGLVRLVTAYAFADLVVDSQRRRLPGRGK